MSSFSPTPAEQAIVAQIFAKTDPNGLGIVTGDAAVRAFAASNLSPSILGDIWTIADKENNGFLTRKGVAIAIRLIGHAQMGEKITEDLVNQPGPVARIGDLTKGRDGLTSPPKSPPPRPPQQPQSTSLPPLTAQDKAKFIRIFQSCGPENGLLNGDKARDVFLKSQLPYEKLSKIWALADAQDRGSLDQTDFVIAMYLIQASMSGQLPVIPPSLPSSLYAQASTSNRPIQSIATHGTGTSGSSSPSYISSFPGNATHSATSPLVSQGTGAGGIPLQTTGQTSAFQQTNFAHTALTANMTGSALGSMAFPTVKHWDVSPAEKAKFDQYFDSLDTQKRGYIEGDVAVPFMLQSKLSEDILAQIWDLADLNNDGRLTRDGFAVAMHLINGKIAGSEVPAKLPESLIPLSMRQQVHTQNAALVPSNQATSVPEAIRDLLWDDSPPTSATNVQFPAAAAPQNQHNQTNIHQPPQFTGPGRNALISPGSVFATSNIAPAQSPTHDLLSDDDSAAVASSVPDNSAEIGNLQIQLKSTNSSLELAKNERVTAEKSLAEQATQISTLQTQLSSAKASYETETRLLSSLRERVSTQASDIQRTREELIRAESDLSAVRVEKTEWEGSLLRDKEELRELRRRMEEVGESVEKTKVEIEKLKKEAKQQKGLLAIARKQLLAREAEKLKATKELEAAAEEVEITIKEREDIEEAQALPRDQTLPANDDVAQSQRAPPRADSVAFAATFPLPTSPSPPSVSGSVVSPTTSKSNNPFDKLVQSAAASSRTASPFQQLHETFDAPHQAEASSQPLADAKPLSQDTTQIRQLPGSFGLDDDVSPFMSRMDADTILQPSSISPKQVQEDPFGFPDVADKSGTASIDTSIEESHATSFPLDIPKDSAEAAWPVLPITNGSSSAISASTRELVGDGGENKGSDTALPHDTASKLGSAVPVTGADDRLNRTDLNEQLKEIDHDESDSDSDSEDETIAKVANGKEAINHNSSANVKTTTSGPQSTDQDNGELIEPAKVSPVQELEKIGFNDIFSTSENTTESKPPEALSLTSPALTDHLAEPFAAERKSDKTPEAEALGTGLSAFDEALGKISSKSEQPAPHSLFTGFEDNFDFMGAKAASGQTEPEASVAVGVPVSGTLTHAGTEPSFTMKESNSTSAQTEGSSGVTGLPVAAFPQVSTSTQNNNPFTITSPEPKSEAGDHGITFGEVFGGNEGASVALSLGNSIQSKQADKDTTHSPKTQSASSLPSSPPGPSTRSIASTSSPPNFPPSQHPGRSSSPKPRFSTGSSNDGHSSSKVQAQTKHSKLSIRLPFGRKKKKTEEHQPPIPQGFLSPVSEPSGATTPAVEDDVEPVKQLCGMGFSRSQVVNALEQNGYDVQKALNKLVGSG